MSLDGKDAAGRTPGNGFTALCLSWNVILSIVIVILNKWVYVYVNFPNVTMTMYHFMMTFAGLLVCRAFNVFQVKHLPLRQMLPLAMSFCGFVVLTNLSLGHNTVGTYQIIKMLTMPTIMVIQNYWYNKSFSLGIKLTLIPLTLGVYLSTCYDIRFNLLGTFYALAGVFITSLYQVWVGEKQKEFQVNSMQLLFYQAPLSALMLMVLVPFIEPPWAPGGFLYQSWSRLHLVNFSFSVPSRRGDTKFFGLCFCPGMMVSVSLSHDGSDIAGEKVEPEWRKVIAVEALVLLTGVVAFLVNLSIYWIIGNTSAVTYNVVGHMKFVLVLAGGFIVFQDPIHFEQAIGIVVTVTGMLLYTYIKLKEVHEASSPAFVQAKLVIKS